MQKISSFSVKRQLAMGKSTPFQAFIAPLAQFSTGGKRVYGGLKDQDRIFTNLYKDGDPFIDGALKRVSFVSMNMLRVIGTGLRTFSSTGTTGALMRSRSLVSEEEEVLVSQPGSSTPSCPRYLMEGRCHCSLKSL